MFNWFRRNEGDSENNNQPTNWNKNDAAIAVLTGFNTGNVYGVEGVDELILDFHRDLELFKNKIRDIHHKARKLLLESVEIKINHHEIAYKEAVSRRDNLLKEHGTFLRECNQDVMGLAMSIKKFDETLFNSIYCKNGYNLANFSEEYVQIRLRELSESLNDLNPQEQEIIYSLLESLYKVHLLSFEQRYAYTLRSYLNSDDYK